MLKIGHFSRLSQVPVKTLRYYDEIGLLKPERVDPFTGYRYYSIHQLPRLNRILALKDLGLSLEQIAHLLEGDLSTAEIQGMLHLEQARLEDQLQEIQAQLDRIAARLNQIELEGKMPDYDIVLKTTEPMLVASQRLLIPTNDQVPNILGPAFNDVCDYIDKQGGKITGPGIAVWHTSPDTYTNEDVEAVYPIVSPLPESEHIKVYELPSQEIAAVVHQGEFDEFTNGHKALLKWLEAHGYRLNGAYREIYHQCEDRQHSTTEVQFPVEKCVDHRSLTTDRLEIKK